MYGGRPTEYNDQILEKANEYLQHRPQDEVVHSIEGLADFIDVARSTIYKWADEKPLFSDIVNKVLEKQAKTLANKGLNNEFNASITKLMLTKHGYSDKQEVDTNLKGTIDHKITGMKIIADGIGIQDQKQETTTSS